MAGHRVNEIVAKLESLGCGSNEEEFWAAEVGIWEGYTSAMLLARLPGLRLFMVDKWSVGEPDSDYVKSGDSAALATEEKLSKVRKIAHAVTHFADEDGRRTIIQSDSVEAALQILNETLDLAFIDADHTYQSALRDMKAWWPKVRKGGYLGGHDYEGQPPPHKFGVTAAVETFASEVSHPVTFGMDSCWWIKKEV